MIRAYLVDDEPPAIARLRRMLRATERVDVIGASSDPVEALEELQQVQPDVLFLDIHMPGLSGFDLLAGLPSQPLVIFTTAYDEHALEAFQTNSVDYLLKPIEASRLDRALQKAERMLGQGAQTPGIATMLAEIVSTLKRPPGERWLSRVASRSGDRIDVIDLRHVTHFYARDKLTFAATPERSRVVDYTIAELEGRLNPRRFVRIHRAAIVNIEYLLDIHAEFGGRMVVRLNDGARTSLPVARDRVRALRERLGL